MVFSFIVSSYNYGWKFVQKHLILIHSANIYDIKLNITVLSSQYQKLTLFAKWCLFEYFNVCIYCFVDVGIFINEISFGLIERDRFKISSYQKPLLQ